MLYFNLKKLQVQYGLAYIRYKDTDIKQFFFFA